MSDFYNTYPFVCVMIKKNAGGLLYEYNGKSKTIYLQKRSSA